MKFQQLGAFEKHLEKAAPNHLSRVYLIVSGCADERRAIGERVKGAIGKKEKGAQSLCYNAQEAEWGKVREELNSASFLGGCRIVVLDEVDKLKKEALASLVSYVARPSPFVYLLLGAASAKALGELYESGKKECIVCDLSGEKPWERKERVKASVVARVAKEGKRITPGALEMVMGRTGAQPAMLEQELAKLLCYCAERGEIAERDVQAVGIPEKALSVWACAEAIVWQGGTPGVDASFDLSSFLVILGQVRSHLQQGLQLALHLAEGKPLATLSLPLFKPQMLEKIAPLARRRTAVFFKEKLKIAFEMEVMAKSASLPPRLLLDMLAVKIK